MDRDRPLIQPRAYQREAHQALLGALREHRRVLYVLPTGGGKTVVTGWLVQQWARSGQRVLYVVHTDELVEQTWRTLLGGYGLRPAEVGIIRGEDRRAKADASVQIATVQTLARRKTQPAAEIVVVDEAHHATAATWSGVLSWYGQARVVGVTATPARLDGTPLGRVFERMIVGPDVETLIALGHLRRPRCFVAARVNSHGEIVKLRRGRALAGDIAEALVKHAQGRNGVVFAATVAHATRLVEELAAAGFRTRLLTGETPLRERRQMLAPGGWLDRGTKRLVVTVDVLNEGYDLPSLKLAVFARRTNSLAMYLHQIGRIMRPHLVTAEGHEWSPLVLDHAGNVVRHGVPWESRTWSLGQGQASEPDAQDEGEAPVRPWGGGGTRPRAKVCPLCHSACALAATVCQEPGCGYEFPRAGLPKVNTAIALHELAPASAEKRAAYWREWYVRSVERQLAAGVERERAEATAREMADKATRMWFGEEKAA